MGSENNLPQASILMFICTIVRLVFTFSLIPSIYESFIYADIAVQRPTLLTIFILGIIRAVFQGFIGYKGYEAWQEEENFQSCIKLGIAFLIFKILCDVLYFFLEHGDNIIVLILSYSAPIFYIYGAIISKSLEDSDYYDED